MVFPVLKNPELLFHRYDCPGFSSVILIVAKGCAQVMVSKLTLKNKSPESVRTNVESDLLRHPRLDSPTNVYKPGSNTFKRDFSITVPSGPVQKYFRSGFSESGFKSAPERLHGKKKVSRTEMIGMSVSPFTSTVAMAMQLSRLIAVSEYNPGILTTGLSRLL